ncbi:MAG TPA: sulfite exporter TauE/SafE family protein [Terriglobia bacterium]|nr:sulfite exporter TauE/SafE family protein [Terriglobia bacterium]
MSVFDFTALVWFGSLVAGFLGALTGLGGGVVIVPLLALALHVNIHYAMGASLVSVIATSSGAAAAYLKEGFSNIRVAMFLEMATTWGAIFGAFLVAKVSTPAIGVIFGVVLLLSAYLSSRPRKRDHMAPKMGSVARLLRLDGSFPEGNGLRHYNVRRTPLGFAMMFVAGTLSGLLGIGSGAFKVLAMDQAMGIPFKVSTTTSNFMIGVTAAASAGVYLRHGYIEPGLAMPVMLGVLMGSFAGTRVLVSAQTNRLRLVFALVIVVLGVEMIYNGLTGKL